MLCLAFPSGLKAAVSNKIFLKVLSLIKSTPRFVRGHLEVIHLAALGKNADFATSTKPFGVSSGEI